MNVAIDSMIGEYRTAFFQLLLGIFGMHISLILFFWIELRYNLQALLLTIGVAATIAVELRFVSITFMRFRLPASKVVTGKFEGREAVNAGEQAGLRDRGEIDTVSHLISDQGTAGLGIAPTDAAS